MVHSRIVQKQLQAIGADKLFWGRFELAELPKIMIPGEIIELVQHGHYSGGFATLVATNHRLLLIDKKPFFLTVIDLRYDMVAEVVYSHQFIGATLHIQSFNKDFKFQSFNKPNLRDMANFIQHKVMEMRGHHSARPDTTQSVLRQPIPRQVFSTSENSLDELTDAQANALLPLTPDTWYRLHPNRRSINPYAQTPLLTRRRVGRFDFVNHEF
jgi:hypothetical protein